MFYESNRFDAARVLETHWRSIRDEYLSVRDEVIDWFERELYGEGWKVYGLFDFPHGRAIAANVRRCPVTAGLVTRCFPRHGAAGFSVLEPGTRILPHEGYAGPFLRCHLGLIVPDGDCGLSVAAETRRWQEGKTLFFDDRVEHAAWNLTSGTRVVLLVDFVPDPAVASAAAGR
jgi:beta-hydroxylase